MVTKSQNLPTSLVVRAEKVKVGYIFCVNIYEGDE